MSIYGERIIGALNERLADDDPSIAARVIAREIVGTAELADCVGNWAGELAEQTLTALVLKHRQSARQTSGRSSSGAGPRGESRPAAFRNASLAAEEGDLVPISSFTLLDSRHIDAEGAFKPLREFTSKDLQSLANRYQESAQRDVVVAQFYRNLAQLTGRRTIGEAFDEGQLREAYMRITGTDRIEPPRKELTA